MKQELVLTMLRQVLGAMMKSRLDVIYFVSCDSLLIELSESLGAAIVEEPGRLGVNGAVELANATALKDGADATLVVFSDIPLITREDVDGLIREGLRSDRCVVASPSTRGGTNALWRKPPTIVQCRYGENSFITHRLEAQRAGVPFFTYRSDRISLDVDTPEDLMLLLGKAETSEKNPFISRVSEILEHKRRTKRRRKRGKIKNSDR